METTRTILPKKRIKQLNKENITDILHLLQPVSCTDNEHQADFYGNGIGLLIKSKQQAFISVFKASIINCTNKQQIQHLFNVLNADINYFPAFVINDKLKKGRTEWWESDFGKKILSEWRWMLVKVISHLNDMIEVV